MDRREAERKAKNLFLSLLTKEQLKEFNTVGYVTVVGGVTNQPYKILPGYSGNVRTSNEVARNFGACGCNGCTELKFRSICCHMMTIDAPYWDHMVAQLLHIRHNEADFLKTAYIN